MNVLSRDKQIEIIAALCEGVGQRSVARMADVDRKVLAPFGPIGASTQNRTRAEQVENPPPTEV